MVLLCQYLGVLKHKLFMPLLLSRMNISVGIWKCQMAFLRALVCGGNLSWFPSPSLPVLQGIWQSLAVSSAGFINVLCKMWVLPKYRLIHVYGFGISLLCDHWNIRALIVSVTSQTRLETRHLRVIMFHMGTYMAFADCTIYFECGSIYRRTGHI